MQDKPPPDLDTLARRFLELWQDQMQASLADPATGEVLGRAAEAWAPLMQAWAGAMGGAMPAPNPPAAPAHPEERHSDAAESPSDGPRARPRSGGGRGPDTATAGTTAAADALPDRDEFLHELDRRLRRIEERLDQLGTNSAGEGKSPRKRAGKP